MDNAIKKALGAKIREKREALNLSQTELARSVNKSSPAYIAFIEAGGRNVSSMDLMLIAKQLGTTVAELMGERKDKNPKFLQALRSSSDINAKDKKEIESFYKYLKSKNSAGRR